MLYDDHILREIALEVERWLLQISHASAWQSSSEQCTASHKPAQKQLCLCAALFASSKAQRGIAFEFGSAFSKQAVCAAGLEVPSCEPEALLLEMAQ